VYAVRFTPIQRTFYPTVNGSELAAGEPRQTVVQVASAEELATILVLANECGEPVHVRQGTGPVSIDLENPFPPGALIVDLRRLDHFCPNPGAGYVELGPALTMAEANRRLAPLGYEFPVAVEPVTWGGLVSINLSGHLVDVLAGKPGDYVLGLKVVLPTGKIIETGTRALRRVVGPDLTRVFIGGQALFGVITELRLRLVPTAGARAWGWAVFDDIDSLVRSVQAIHSQRLPYPILLELVESSFVRVSGLDRLVPPGELLLVAMQGERDQDARWKLETILGAATSHGSTGAAVLAGEEEWSRLWEIRMSPHHYLDGEYLIGEVMDVPIDRLLEGVHAVLTLRDEAESAWPGLSGHLWGHIATGTLHPAYANPPDWSYAKRIEVAAWLRQRVLAIKLDLGASVGEQGIFPAHADWFKRRYGESSLSLVQQMKAAFDPNNVLNPGRITPERAGSRPGTK
jgi:glycolate oxidase